VSCYARDSLPWRQVLYVNMIISVSLGGAISFEVAEEGIMERKPRASEPAARRQAHLGFARSGSRRLWS